MRGKERERERERECVSERGERLTWFLESSTSTMSSFDVVSRYKHKHNTDDKHAFATFRFG